MSNRDFHEQPSEAHRNAACIEIMQPMQLDLIIPTLRRPSLLRALLASVARADPPRAMRVSVTIVNNDSNPLVLEPEFLAPPYPVRVLQERRPGKSAALNTGIAA